MKTNSFENKLKNIKGTMAVENMTLSKSSITNLKRIETGAISYAEVIAELKQKYTQRV